MTASEPVQILPGLNVSRETEAKLRHMIRLVEKWNAHINLVSANSLGDIWSRHVLDSAQLFKYLPPDARHWADLGSGGGFPGLIVCILAQELHPGLKVTLIESDRRKAVFLQTVARELKLSPHIQTTRIESALPLRADVLTARALGPLPQLIRFAQMHLSKTGIALFPKGRIASQEIAAAQQDWHFDLVSFPSLTSEEACILRIENIRNV